MVQKWKNFQKIFLLTNSSAFLDAHLSSDKAEFVSTISANSPDTFFLDVTRKQNTTATSALVSNVNIKVMNDLTGEEIVTDNFAQKWLIPTTITKNTGVYRALLIADDGVSGEITFSVTAGQISQISLKPVSEMMVKGSDTLVTLALEDSNGNSVSPNVYSVELSVENGSIIDANGNFVKNLRLDIFDSFLTFTLHADNAGTTKISAKVTDNTPASKKEFTTQKDLMIFDEAKVRLQFETP